MHDTTSLSGHIATAVTAGTSLMLCNRFRPDGWWTRCVGTARHSPSVPAVREVAVVGQPDAYRGETVKVSCRWAKVMPSTGRP
jgi:hypothetical protein